jgi:GMP synthase (glutamine-hydrolysing)
VTPRRVLLVKTGTTNAVVRRALGDYDRWFRRALGATSVPLAIEVVEAHLGARLRRPAGVDAVIATGSPRSVTERAPWMSEVAAWLLDAATARVPVLGVCFGHQLIADALGGDVRRSPRGRELGTVTCSLTDAGRADPLFAGVPETFEVQATHEDEVSAAPPGVTVLARNGHSEVQAFRAGPHLAGVQFHPEADAATMSALVESRVAGLEAEARACGEDPVQRVRALRAGIRETPWGERVLRNFVVGIGG